jgi:hypothetical protein
MDLGRAEGMEVGEGGSCRFSTRPVSAGITQSYKIFVNYNVTGTFIRINESVEASPGGPVEKEDATIRRACGSKIYLIDIVL